MKRKPTLRPTGSARERLLSAADALFYSEGINTVGIDRVIETAGVAKASLYDCFGSKEELVRSYLEARLDARKARMTARIGLHESAREKILSLFDSLADAAAQPGFRGCAFVRASSETRHDSSVREVCNASREWIFALLKGLAAEAGAKDPQRLARQLVLLYDGASVSALFDGKRSVAHDAREIAAGLVDASVGASGKPKPTASRRPTRRVAAVRHD